VVEVTSGRVSTIRGSSFLLGRRIGHNGEVTPGTQTERIAKVKRNEILDAALDELKEVGWRALRMRDVASRVGVSRQTVYNTLGSRRQLAASLVSRLTDRFLAGTEAAFQRPGRLFDQWLDGVSYALREGSDNPALRAMLSSASDDRFLELLTRGAEPLVTAARSRLAIAVLRGHPDLNPKVVDSAAEAVARLVISHIVLPLHSSEVAARNIAMMVTSWMEGNVAHPATV